MSEFINEFYKNIEELESTDWNRYTTVELIDWLYFSFRTQRSLINTIERKEIIIESLKSKLKELK